MSSTFREQFRTECIEKSAIAPELFETAIAVIEDEGRYEMNPERASMVSRVEEESKRKGSLVKSKSCSAVAVYPVV